MGDWSLALFLAWLATAVILFSATYLYRLLGERALTAIERLMGMLLVALSVQMFLDGSAWRRSPARGRRVWRVARCCCAMHPLRGSMSCSPPMPACG
jgi:uncharacterized membrane protein YfcA